MIRAELNHTIPVNVTQKNPDTGFEISIVGEPYKARALSPDKTVDHEAIHAGLGGQGEVEMVTVIPGPGYNGLTRFRRPNAIAALGPHSVGAKGTEWDVMVARKQGYGAGSMSAAKSAVREKHSAIVEIADELAKKKTLTGTEIDAARDRARNKDRYGAHATIIAFSKETGEKVSVSGVKVEGDQTKLPITVVDFSERLTRRREEERAKDALVEKVTEDPTKINNEEVRDKMAQVRAELATLATAA